MAEIVYVQINGTNIIVGVHSEALNESLLPDGHTVVQKTVDDPQGLVGLPDSLIDETIDKRPDNDAITPKALLRQELKQLSNEIDLMERLEEQTTDIQADFDAKKAIYETLPD